MVSKSTKVYNGLNKARYRSAGIYLPDVGTVSGFAVTEVVA